MRQNWLKVFLLCVACVVCLHGNCFAWVQFYNDQHRLPKGESDNSVYYYVDENFVNVQEYNGRKYLELIIKSQIFIEPRQRHILLDVERNAAVEKDCIEIIERTGRNTAPPVYRALLQWAEKKYPSLINELREHNQNHPLPNSASGQSTTSISSTSQNFPAGDVGDLTPHVDYTILESGAVRYESCNVPHGFYLIRKPESLKDFPGTYTGGLLYNDKYLIISEFYEFDSNTNTLTVYSYEGGWRDIDNQRGFIQPEPKRVVYWDRCRVIDRNTVYMEQLDIIPVMNGLPNARQGESTLCKFPHPESSADEDNWWRYVEGDPSSIGLFAPSEVEVAVLFASLRGNIGYPPEEWFVWLNESKEAMDAEMNDWYQN